MTDPFAAHPELRPLIRDPSQSAWRRFTAGPKDESVPNPAQPLPKVRSVEEREASRLSTLASQTGDLWVFAYGSLMWDPALDFVEVRRAWLPGHSRRFILRDIFGARGTHEAPGLMAALDRGEGCHGLAFRVAAERVENETRSLWEREMSLPAYVPRLLPADIDGDSVAVLGFLADHESDLIRADLTREEQLRLLTTGTGFLGSSREYLETIAQQFASLGIEDTEVSTLLADVRALVRSDAAVPLLRP